MDLYNKLRPGASQHRLVWIGRFATTIMVLIGLLWIGAYAAYAAFNFWMCARR